MTPADEARFITLWQAVAADVSTHCRKHVMMD
jgi:hypothetical protein